MARKTAVRALADAGITLTDAMRHGPFPGAVVEAAAACGAVRSRVLRVEVSTTGPKARRHAFLWLRVSGSGEAPQATEFGPLDEWVAKGAHFDFVDEAARHAA